MIRVARLGGPIALVKDGDKIVYDPLCGLVSQI